MDAQKVPIQNTIVLIPALNPDARLVRLIQGLQEEGLAHIIVVDDGSTSNYRGIFDEVKKMGCDVVHHEQNHGKGAAIKTALETAAAKYGSWGFITVDADGQHLPKDVRRISEVMEQQPASLVLGVRDFSQKHVPTRSRLGNRITSLFFRLVTGVSCPDTQTGLRGIPQNLLSLARSEEGER